MNAMENGKPPMPVSGVRQGKARQRAWETLEQVGLYSSGKNVLPYCFQSREILRSRL